MTLMDSPLDCSSSINLSMCNMCENKPSCKYHFNVHTKQSYGKTLTDSTMKSLFYSENLNLNNIDQNDECDSFSNISDLVEFSGDISNIDQIDGCDSITNISDISDLDINDLNFEYDNNISEIEQPDANR